MKGKRIISFILCLLVLLSVPATIRAEHLTRGNLVGIEDIRARVIRAFEEKFDNFTIYRDEEDVFEYGYSLNGEVYKIIEYFNDPSDKLNSQEDIYVLSDNGEYIEVETSEHDINNIAKYFSLENSLHNESLSEIIPYSENPIYYDTVYGSNKIERYTVRIVVAVIVAVVGAPYGALGAAAAAAVDKLVDIIIDETWPVVYYKKVIYHVYRASDGAIKRIINDVTYYSDSSRRNEIGRVLHTISTIIDY